MCSTGVYDLLERIGKGSFGEVFRGRHRETDETVAIKVIDLEQADDEIDDIQQEITVMAQCNSPHVTKFATAAKVWHPFPESSRDCLAGTSRLTSLARGSS